MVAFRKKIAFFLLSFFLFFTVVSQLPPTTVHAAGCPANVVCAAVTAACLLPATQNALFPPDDPNGNCIPTLYPVMYAIFNPGKVVPPWYNPDPQTFGAKVFDETNPDEIFGERYTYAQISWIFNSVILFFFPALKNNSAGELIAYLVDIVNVVKSLQLIFDMPSGTTMIMNDVLPKYGFIGQTYWVMAQLPKYIFTDPISSGVGEVKLMASKLNIISPVYAQGLGYDKLGIGAIKNLWIATRNMAYLISTIILIAAGFMVLFRTKISPQASVTVQMIIPRLAISLVLVTFSYAIVGFVIDLLYVLITAVLGLISFSTGTTIISNLSDAIANLTGSFDFVLSFLGMYIVIAILIILLTFALLIGAAVFSAGLLGPIVLAVMGFAGGFFMWSIYVWARIVGQLITAYITLILLTIAGPLMIIVDILPTSKGAFQKWLSCIVGNVAVFGTYAFLAVFIRTMFSFWLPFSGFSSPPASGTIITSGFSLPGFVGGYPRGNFLLQYFIYVGFMSMVPNIVAAVKNMFCKSPDVSNFLENTVKDTIGQISKAGQASSDAIKSYGERSYQRTEHETRLTDQTKSNAIPDKI